MTKQQAAYQSYVLRLWRPSDKEGSTWRASLQSARTREQKNFASLDDLFEFLRAQTGVSPGVIGKEGEGLCTEQF